MKRLAILSTHPIQYNAPLFRMLHEEDGIDLQVFFSKTWNQVKYDPDFQREVTWDIPVSDGYSDSTHDASTQSGQRALAQAIRAFQPDALLVYGWNFPGHFHTMRQFHGRVPVWFRGQPFVESDAFLEEGDEKGHAHLGLPSCGRGLLCGHRK